MRSLHVGWRVLAVFCLSGFALAQAEREAPRAAQRSWIEASIRAVQDNGVADRVSRDFGVQKSDGTRELPIKHVVACDTETSCQRVARWARRAGLAPSALRPEFQHGGVPYYLISLRQRVPLAIDPIQEQALRVHDAIRRIPEARYDTWMLDTDPDGGRDAR